jgi:hypothetical protein
MKKIFLITSLFCAGIIGAFAQEEKERLSISEVSQAHKYLPVKGDFGISIDAAPFFEFIGNMFNGTDRQGAPSFGNDFGIKAIYFLEDNRSVRAALHLSIGNDIFKGTVQDDHAFIQPGFNGQTVIDVEKRSFTDVALFVGYSYHRGYGRLQAFYGPEVGIGCVRKKTSYTYANSITEANQDPSTFDFGENLLYDGRLLEQKYGNELGFYLGGFIGVEYFIAPKLSIGGEVRLGLDMFNRWQGTTTTEKWDSAQGEVVENSARSLNGWTGGINLGTMTKGAIFVNFYF